MLLNKVILDISLQSRQKYRSQYSETWKEWQFAVVKGEICGKPNSRRQAKMKKFRKKAASAKRRERNIRKSENRLRLREKLVDAARKLAIIQRDLGREMILLEWIEQQHSIIASEGSTFIHDIEGNHTMMVSPSKPDQGAQKTTRDPTFSRAHPTGSWKLGNQQKPRLAFSGRLQ